MEFSGFDEGGDGEDAPVNGSEHSDALGLHLPNPNADKANAQRGKSLEVLLATKNQRILAELTKFRVRSLTSISELSVHLECVKCTVLNKESARRARGFISSFAIRASHGSNRVGETTSAQREA